jgi:two-component system sensor histidine kinase QseC
LVLVLEDTGAGIPEDELPLVTKRFYRGRRKSDIGSGLGLAITELALKRLGGSLALSNRTDGSGLRAEIRLPAPRRPSPPLRETVPVHVLDVG